MAGDARERFSDLAEIARGDGEVDLCEAALVIASEDDPSVSVEAERARIAALAEQARSAVGSSASVEDRVRGLNRFLFEDQGFQGNRDEYYDPRNSFLHEVLSRRTGIPITLSILYCEIARALGLEARGVGFPGHFLVRIEAEEAHPWMVDPFSAQLLDRAGCTDLLRHFLGPGAELSDDILMPARSRDVVFRLISNLKNVYLQAGEFERMLGCCERLLLLSPDAALELRDRGLVLHRLDCPGPAISDLERFLELAPGHESAPAVKALLADLRAAKPALH